MLKRIELATPLGDPIEGSVIEIQDNATYLLRLPADTGPDSLKYFVKGFRERLDEAYKDQPTKRPFIMVMYGEMELYELHPAEEPT